MTSEPRKKTLSREQILRFLSAVEFDDVWDLSRVVGHNLREVREAAKLTQSQLAALLRSQFGFKWDGPRVSKVESGQRRIDLDELLALGYVLQVTVMELVFPYSQWDPDTGIQVGTQRFAGAEFAYDFLLSPHTRARTQRTTPFGDDELVDAEGLPIYVKVLDGEGIRPDRREAVGEQARRTVRVQAEFLAQWEAMNQAINQTTRALEEVITASHAQLGKLGAALQALEARADGLDTISEQGDTTNGNSS